MSINKLNNMLNILGLGRKVEKPKGTAQTSSVQAKSNLVPEGIGKIGEEDSVSISFEGVIKEAVMKVKEDMETMREDKIADLRQRISSGVYQVNPEDVARAIMRGRTDLDEEKK